MMHRTIFQSEASDCGIACLAMVYARHNSSASLRQVRDCIGTFARGMTAGDLLLAAEKLGLSARCIRIDIEELSEVALPAILHWGMNHFVVFDGIRRGRYIIRDPAEGIRHVSKSELDSNFTGVCFEFDPAVRILDVRKRTWGPGKEWIGKLPILSEAVRLLSLSILIEVCGLTTPMLIRYVLNSSSGISDIIFQIILYSGCLVGLLVQALTISYRQQIVDYLRVILNRRMSLAVLRHLLSLPVNFFSSRSSADIVSRCHSVDDVYAVYSGALAARLLDVVVAAISVSIMIAFSWKLAIVPIGSAIAYSLIRSFMHKPALEAHAAEIRARTRLDEMLLESVKGVGIIKSYSGIEFRISQLNNKISESLGSQLRTSRLTSLFHLFSSSCFSIDLVICIALGVFFVLKSELTIGDFMAFLFIRQTFMMKYCGAFDGVMAVRALDVHLERVAEITSAHRSTCYLSVLMPANTSVVDREFANLTVACSDVYFRYEGGSSFLINGFNYRFLYGLSYALVGPSGCGKSTLAKMLCGLILPASGNICLESAGFAETEKAIRAVFPEDILFAGSISENVALWASQIDIDAVERALADACLLQDVQSLPMGLDTPVGEGGSLLSAGQRQRLLIARALYCDPKILILDEATSQLDRNTERQILINLDKRGMTRIHCAHHSQVIECCDHILVSDEFHSFSEISKLTLSQ